MVRAGFLSTTERADLIELARDGLVEHRLVRRGNALVLLDRGMSCSQVGAVLLLDDDTVRTWFRLYREDGIEGLAGFGYEGGSCHLSPEQRERLRSWVAEMLPRTTRHVGAWIEREFAIVYQSRSGLIALLHRLGMEHRKPQSVSRKLDETRQKAFIEAYESLLHALPGDEAVMFADAVHPTHAPRPSSLSDLTRIRNNITNSLSYNQLTPEPENPCGIYPISLEIRESPCDPFLDSFFFGHDSR